MMMNSGYNTKFQTEEKLLSEQTLPKSLSISLDNVLIRTQVDFKVLSVSILS